MQSQDANTSNESDHQQGVWLLAVAAPREFVAVARAIGMDDRLPSLWEVVRGDRFDVVHTGVGKSNASGAVACAIDRGRHVGVLSVGIAGAILGTRSSECDVGDVVCACSSIFADEGVQTGDGFESCAQIGFPPFDDEDDKAGGGDGITHASSVVEWLGGYSDHIGPVACVSQCSGTDAGAHEIQRRSKAIAEAMEGAAVGLAAKRIDPSLLTGELRVISNMTGDRDAQRWDLDGALIKLGEVLGRINDGLG